MIFNTTTFVVSTSVNKNAPARNTTVTLTESDIPDATVVSALTSGQSPRVRLQTNLRANGIPDTLEMKWSEYVIPGRVSHVTAQMSPEQIAERAMNDSTFLDAMLAKLREKGAIE